MEEILFLILAGGRGERLKPLTVGVPKPLVRFGISGRIIDFTLYNCLAACEGGIVVLTQYLSDMIDRYLQDQLRDPDFAARFKKAGEAWDLAIQLAALRKESGLSQKALAARIGTSQQQISRLESPSYEGHSLSMIRRVAEALGATVHVEIERVKHSDKHTIAESKTKYKRKR